jgi:hypothetical protein
MKILITALLLTLTTCILGEFYQSPTTPSYQMNITDAYYTLGFDASNTFPITMYDQRTQFQAAFDLIKKNGGGTLYIQEGVYEIDWYVEFGSNLKITGAGIDKTVIKLRDMARSFKQGTTTRSGILRGRNCRDVIISNLTIDGNKYNQRNDNDGFLDYYYGRYGLYIEACNNTWFDFVKVTKCQGYGFDPHGAKKKGIWGVNNTISNCISELNGIDGFTLDQSYNFYIFNNVARLNARHGFNIVTGAKGVQMYNNLAYANGYFVTNSSGCGFMVQNNQNLGTGDVVLINNTAEWSKKAGFCFNDVFGIVMKNNTANYTCTCINNYESRSSQVYDNRCFSQRYVASVNNINPLVYENNPQLFNPSVFTIGSNFVRLASCKNILPPTLPPPPIEEPEGGDDGNDDLQIDTDTFPDNDDTKIVTNDVSNAIATKPIMVVTLLAAMAFIY